MKCDLFLVLWWTVTNDLRNVKWEKNTCWEGTYLRQTASFEPLCVKIFLCVWQNYLSACYIPDKGYYGTLSGSHGRSFRICHEKVRAALLAEDWRWRHIRLAIKPRYLGNHASQIKSYYWTLLGILMVALSEYVMKKCVLRYLAEDWRWRHRQSSARGATQQFGLQ